MSLRNYVEEFEHTDAKGVDNTSPINLLTAGFVREAWNVDLGLIGGYTKRKGYMKYFVHSITPPVDERWKVTILGTEYPFSILQGVEFIPHGPIGHAHQLFFGLTQINTSALGYRSNYTGTITTLTHALSSTKRPVLLPFGDRVLIANIAAKPLIYEATDQVREVGLQAPAVAPVVADTAGTDLAPGTYVLAYTYILVDNTTGLVIAESSPSPAAQVTLSALNLAIDVTVVVSPDTAPTGRTLKIRVYRTTSAGTVMMLPADGTIANASATEKLADPTLLSNRLPAYSSKLQSYQGYDHPKYAVAARGRLFVANKSIAEVRWSKIGLEGSMYETFLPGSVATCETYSGSMDNIVGLATIRDIPIVLKRRSIGLLEEVGLPDIAVDEDKTGYIYREISNTCSCASHFAYTQVYNELVFLGVDSVYATDGQQVRDIGLPVQAIIKSCDFKYERMERVSMVNDQMNKRIYCSLYYQGSSTPDLVMVGDYQQYPNFRWTFYHKFENPLAASFSVGCFMQFHEPASDERRVYFGNFLYNGNFYEMNLGNNDDGAAISTRIVTRPYAMGHPHTVKLFKTLRVIAETADDSYPLSFRVAINLSKEETDGMSFTVPGLGGKWADPAAGGPGWSADDSGTLGTSPDPAEQATEPLVWSGDTTAEVTYDVHTRAKWIQFSFEQLDADAPMGIMGWSIGASIFGGR